MEIERNHKMFLREDAMEAARKVKKDKIGAGNRKLRDNCRGSPRGSPRSPKSFVSSPKRNTKHSPPANCRSPRTSQKRYPSTPIYCIGSEVLPMISERIRRTEMQNVNMICKTVDF